MQANQLPYWIQIVQALGPTLVAVVVGLVAGYIAYRQWRTSNTKLKLDLFKDRFEIFDCLDAIDRAWRLSRGEDWVDKYFDRMQEATRDLRKFKLLFPRSIETRLDELIRRCDEFADEKSDGEAIQQRPSPEWSEHVRKSRELRDQVEEASKALRKEVADCIRIDWKG